MILQKKKTQHISNWKSNFISKQHEIVATPVMFTENEVKQMLNMLDAAVVKAKDRTDPGQK